METPIQILKDTLSQLIVLSTRHEDKGVRQRSKELIPQYELAIAKLEQTIEPEKVNESDNFHTNELI